MTITKIPNIVSISNVKLLTMQLKIIVGEVDFKNEFFEQGKQVWIQLDREGGVISFTSQNIERGTILQTESACQIYGEEFPYSFSVPCVWVMGLLDYIEQANPNTLELIYKPRNEDTGENPIISFVKNGRPINIINSHIPYEGWDGSRSMDGTTLDYEERGQYLLEKFKKQIVFAEKFRAKTEYRPILQGISLELNPSGYRIFVADGYRMIISGPIPADVEPESSPITINGQAINWMRKLSGLSKSNPPKISVGVSGDNEYALFSIPDMGIKAFMRLMHGRPPSFHEVAKPALRDSNHKAKISLVKADKKIEAIVGKWKDWEEESDPSLEIVGGNPASVCHKGSLVDIPLTGNIPLGIEKSINARYLADCVGFPSPASLHVGQDSNMVVLSAKDTTAVFAIMAKKNKG